MTEGTKFLTDWRVLVSLTLLAIVTFYLYFKSQFNYWKERGFPEISARPVPLFGHTFGQLTGRKNFRDTYDELYEAAGTKSFAGYFQGMQPSLLIKDPELIKHILVKDFHLFTDKAFDVDEEIDPLNAKNLANLKGQKWKEMRSRLSPTFSSGRMKAMFPLMKACSDELLNTLRMEIRNNAGQAIIDTKELMACFTTDVIGTCAFGIRCDALQNPEASEFRRMGKLAFQTSWKTILILMLLFVSPKLLKRLGINLTTNESSIFFRKFVKDMVEKRKKAIKEGGGKAAGFGDFIYHLMTVKNLKPVESTNESDEDDSLSDSNIEEENQKSKVPPSTDLSLDDLTSQVMLFFAAGFETTSSLLSFTLYELSSSQNGKDIQRRVREEVDKVMKEDDGKITYEGLKKMHLLDRVLKEILRLYPPAAFLNRKCLEDYNIPGTTLTLEKGSVVFIPNHAMQLDPKYFPDPTRFDPDRFLPGSKDKKEHFSYLPFGEGPRMCVGQRFAEMQARLGLASLLSSFEFAICSEKTSVPIKFKKVCFILEAESKIWLKVTERIGKD